MKHRLLGDMTISRVLEMNTPDFDPYGFFPDTSPEDWEPHLHWLQPSAMDPVSGNLIFPMQSYVVRTKHHTILVDSCVGNDKDRPHRPNWNHKTDTTYIDALAAVGLAPEDIDYVMCTHLHPDHVGWNTKLLDGRWVPTFPNAEYVFSRKEFDYWRDFNKTRPLEHIIDSVLPIEEAGRAKLVASDHAIDDSVWLEPTPGHTPDHFAIRLSSNGNEAVMSGDLMHCPIQTHHPEWAARPDYDVEIARTTRRAFLERYCENGVLVCTAHFPLPSAGWIVPDGNAFRFEYEEKDW
ncbi:MAG: MBL fold metallo-hydrolase [Alphaproteobacteria bacterium]|nr:MBL fold metallo-hydrolase [Alphaproteobacteria bacterium]